MDISNKQLGKNIANIRVRRGLTQSELAQQLNLSAKTISKWETGVNCLSAVELKRLGQVLNVSVDSLLYDDLEMEEYALLVQSIKTLYD